MSERLTEAELHHWRDNGHSAERAMASEVLDLRAALKYIAITFTEDSHGNLKTCPAGFYQDHARAALKPTFVPKGRPPAPRERSEHGTEEQDDGK